MTSPARPGAARRTRKSPLAAQAAALALALKAVVLTALVGCRGGIDDPCRCASDCRAGLVCSAEGEKILEPNVCYESGVNGLCVPAEVQDSDSGPVVITEAPVYMDMASRRDFQPGGGVSESLSDATTDDTTTGPMQMFTPLALEVADFDGDAVTDLLVLGVDNVDGVASRLSRGVGDGSFEAGINPMLSGTSAFPVVGELDPQPGADVMVAQVDGDVKVFRWAGEAFESWKVFTNANVPRTHVGHDVDADDDDDIVWLWWTKDSAEFGLSIRPNSGDGFFAPVDTTVGNIAELMLAPTSLLIGDLNGDDIADALIFEADQPKAMLRLFGTPAGFFGSPKFVLPTVHANVATLGDFDEDGALDVLAFELKPARIVFARGDGKGGFTAQGSTDVIGPFVPSTFAVADLDADGHLDVAVVDVASPELRIWDGLGDGTFAAPKSGALPSPAVRVHAAELDGDVGLELVVATFAAGEVTVLLDP